MNHFQHWKYSKEEWKIIKMVMSCSSVIKIEMGRDGRWREWSKVSMGTDNEKIRAVM